LIEQRLTDSTADGIEGLPVRFSSTWKRETKQARAWASERKSPGKEHLLALETRLFLKQPI
jgi:hypothetical protein